MTALHRATHTFARSIRFSAVTDRLLRRVGRMAFAANGWTQDRLIYECLRHRQGSLARELRKAGLDPEAVANACEPPHVRFDGLPMRPAPNVEDIGPGN